MTQGESMQHEYGKTTVAGLVIAASLLLLDQLTPGVSAFGLIVFLATVIAPALMASEED